MDLARRIPWEYLDLAILLRAFYLAASALIVVIQAVPALRNRFLAYGSRATPSSSSEAHARSRTSTSPLARLLDALASITVPHNYFSHFYLVSVSSSLFWRWMYPETLGIEWKSILSPPPRGWDQVSTTRGQIQLAWLLMMIQGTRRLFESSAYTASSKSRMWFGHWILGLLFYLTVNVAIWVEGASQLTDVDPHDFKATEHRAHEEKGQILHGKRMILFIAVLTAQLMQHSYHAYLYRLRTEHSTYQLPSHSLFPNLLCPHYTCEVAIYLLLSFLTSPANRIVNWTMMTVTVFVFVNLGVTAIGTKQWYIQRFGREKVKGRRVMIPWIW